MWLAAALIALSASGCGSSGGASDAPGVTDAGADSATDAAGDLAADVADPGADAAEVAEAGEVSAAPRLTLALDPSLDDDTTVKATSLAKVELLDAAAKVVGTATLAGGMAAIDIAALAPGDYFVRVNDLDDDPVPTRIDDASTDVIQTTAQTLRESLIGPSAGNATYHVLTFSQGQDLHDVVKYSDGTEVAPEIHAYAIADLVKSTLETRVLGTAALLTSFTAGPTHVFRTWIIGPQFHGSQDLAGCTCHGDINAKAATYASITPAHGMCYRCHYGPGGPDDDGIVDPTE